MPASFEIRRFDPSEADLLRRVRLDALRDEPEAFGSIFEIEAAKPAAFWDKWLAETPTCGAFTADGSVMAGGRRLLRAGH